MNAEIQAIKSELEQRDLLELANRVARAYDVTVDELLSRTHRRDVSHARQVLWAVLSARGHWSQPRLGALFRRDHQTIAFGLAKVPMAEVRRFEQTPEVSR